MRRLLPRSASNPQGFTLIELMVAMAILAILAVAGLVLFTGAQKNARDARRRADVDAIATALETNKVQGATATKYPQIAATQFAANAVPVDTTTAKYCANASDTTVGSIAEPAAADWASTAACPTGAGWKVVDPTDPESLTSENFKDSVAWTVCARLENGSTDTPLVSAKYFCKHSSQ